MKKITLLASLLLSTVFAVQAQQSLQIVSLDSIVVGNAYTDRDISGYAVIENISSVAVEVAFKRFDANYTELTDSNAICWGLCFTSSTSQNPPSFNKVLQPGDRDTAIYYVYPDQDGFTRDGFIDYSLFDYFNPSDSAGFRVNFRVDGKPLSQVELNKPTVSVYPNPADDFLIVQYQVSSSTKNTFELINLVGARVYHTNLDAQQNELEMDLTNLNPGIYFYSLKSDGEVLISKKLVIR
ncbi:MAG: T9SS type A sorting domain-containing protein [Bacteroidetes bacterium]|nr:T9SS type A sorting domain-containing protein [Bacteroidota bacterium]